MPTHLGQEFPRTAAEVTSLLGLTASNLWLFQESGVPVVDVVGGVNLAANWGTPTYAQATAFPRLAVLARANENEGPHGPANSLNDDGVTSHALLMIMHAGASAGNSRQFIRAAGAAYYLADVTAGVVKAEAKDGAGTPVTVTATITGIDHSSRWFPLLWVMDRAANTLRVRTHLGSASASIASLGSCNSVNQSLSFGEGATGTMTPASFTWIMRMSGANAEGLNDAQILQDFWVGP